VGGMENHVSGLARRLTDLGHHVYVATTDLEDKIEDSNGISIHRFRGFYQSLSFAFTDKAQRYPPPLVDPILAWKIRKLVKQVQPDVIHTHGWSTNTVVAAATGMSIPVVTTLHDYGHICPKRTLMYHGHTCEKGHGLHCLACSKNEYGLVKSIMALAGIVTGLRRLKKASKFISVSRYVKQRTDDYFKVVDNQVIPNFIDPKKLVEERPVSGSQKFPEKFILFIGVLGSFKGPDDLIEGFIDARERTAGLSNTELLILGKPQPEKAYMSLPEHKITVVNSPPREMVVEALFRAALLVVPSRVQDACPTVVLEGVAAGAPIVATRVGGIPDLLENLTNSWLVEPYSPAEITERLVELNQLGVLNSPPRRAKIPDGYPPLDPDTVTKKVLALYEQMMSEAGR
jgi:glycosyltransferase involved in cell wall biosynthesis